MNRQQAINYLLSSGFSEEQINTIEQAFKQEPTNDLVVDCISREQAIKQCGFGMTNLLIADCLRRLPPVTPQEPKCKDCKWWKDSDGVYRRGCGAESQCPINRKKVYEGNGYCYLFEPQESERDV